MKSSGLSLQKIMSPLIVTTICLSIGAFYFSNNLLPYTNLKAGSLLYDVRESKPALFFKEGVFNNSIEGFSIRIDKKEKDGKTLRDIMIYDHREMKGNTTVLFAKSGTMQETADKMFLILSLKDGGSYKDILDQPKDAITHPMIRDRFKEKIIRFDLSAFKLNRTNEELFKSNYQMMTLSQLNKVSDSMKFKNIIRKLEFARHLNSSYYNNSSKYLEKVNSKKIKVSSTDYFNKLTKEQKLSIIEAASNHVRNVKSSTEALGDEIESQKLSIYKCNVEWHRKFTLSIACLVLFFIGAPLGAIIRKGGLGMPVVVSVVFFILFHILSITGEKLAKEGKVLPYQGMWMATAILFPIGVFLTVKATSDSTLFDVNAYLEPFRKIFIRKKS
jgi:lipopolysaccharide export system permease protein